MAGDEGFEPPILGPEPSALPLGQSPMISVHYYNVRGGSNRVTFGDPVATSLQISLQEWTPLQPATGGFHPDPGTRTQCLTTWPIPITLLAIRECGISGLIHALEQCLVTIIRRLTDFATPPQLGSHSFVRASGLATRHRRLSHLANPH